MTGHRRSGGVGPDEGGARDEELGAALTDALVGMEALAFAVALARRPVAGTGRVASRATEVRDAFVLFNGATAVAAITGAALHGLFSDRHHPVRRGLWRISLAAIGLSSLAAWRLGTSLALTGRTKSRVMAAANSGHAVYEVAVILVGPPYAVAVAGYVPGAALLGWACARRLNDPSEREGAALALAGLGVTLAAAAIQVLRIRIHPRWLGSNALYHIVQAQGLAIFHVAALRFLEPTGPRPPG